MHMLRSENDKREYRVIELPNKLRALLIQGGDPIIKPHRTPTQDQKYDPNKRDEDDTPTESERGESSSSPSQGLALGGQMSNSETSSTESAKTPSSVSSADGTPSSGSSASVSPGNAVSTDSSCLTDNASPTDNIATTCTKGRGLDIPSFQSDSPQSSASMRGSPSPGASDGKGLFTEKMAAASLTVHCGSLQDPNDIGGVAHYLEHMLFLGSEKYPVENEYTKFIAQQGGTSNAYTNFDSTTFYFEVPPTAFEHALDMFANFFVSPLIREDALDRELQAMDNEFQMNRQYDGARVLEVLMRQAGNHPIGKFSWGNIRSLKEEPARKGVNMRDVLTNFYNSYYSAEVMTLAVQSQHSLDEIERYVKKYFSSIPQRQVEQIKYPEALPYHDNPDFFKLFKIVPVTRRISLTLRWVLPSQRKHYREKVFKYLRYTVSHEAEDGLLDNLRSQQWALDLWASSTDDQNMCSLFTIGITLTEKGGDNLAEVIRFVQQYLHMLRKRGPQKWIWEELRQQAENHFRFKNEENAYSYVCSLSEVMRHCDEKHYLCADELFFEYNPARIQMIMDLMTPDKCNFVYMNHEFQKNAGSFSRLEPWMGTAYEIEELPKEWKELWIDDPKFQEKLKLPHENPYISTDFRIKKDIDVGTVSQRFPVILEDADTQKLWFRKDQKFLRPNTLVNILFATQHTFSTVRESACVGLLVDVFKILIARVSTYAEEASLCHHLSEAEMGLNLSFSGFNHKLPLLIETVLKTLSSIDCSAELFQTVKADRLKYYFNCVIDNSSLAEDVWSYIIQPRNSLYHDRHTVIQSISQNDFIQWTKDVFGSAFLEVYVHGNVTSLDAKDILSMILKNFPERPDKKKPSPLTHVRIDGQTCIRILGINPEATNSFITNHYVYGPAHFYEESLISLFVMFMEERCFTQLRTEDQLGYDAACYVRNSYRVLGFSIGVSPPADKFTLSEVDKRIEAFLDHMVIVFEELSKDEFDTTRESLIKQKSCADLSMDDEVTRNWSEIADFRYIFDRLRLEIKFLETLEMSKFKPWALNVIGRKRQDRKKLSVQVVGHGKVALEECEGGAEIWRQRTSVVSPQPDITKMPPMQLLKPLDGCACQKYIDNLSAYCSSLTFHSPVYVHPSDPFSF
ncbi:nardilysin-like [Varroa destructor]|uniref:Nardilysin n=1 Tax=Varroa destructor TaxID=109461 RepID=A0A7M7L516_VARDE|nr:nardilysin-like [Varroa destructor]